MTSLETTFSIVAMSTSVSACLNEGGSAGATPLASLS